MDRFSLLLATGNLAALSYVPVLGRVITRTGTALRYELMPDFKTTWTNTFDFWGQHSFQRFATPDEFIKYFEAAGNIDVTSHGAGIVVALKRT